MEAFSKVTARLVGDPVAADTSRDGRCAPPSAPDEIDRRECFELPSGLRLQIVQRRLPQDRDESYYGEDTFKFHIMNFGRSHLLFEKSKEMFLNGPTAVMLHHQDGRVKIERTIANVEMTYATVTLSREHFRRYLETEQALVPEALSLASRHDLRTAGMCHWRASASESALVRSIVQFPYVGSLRQLYLESKALEIIYRLSSRGADASPKSEKARVRLNERERACLRYVRERLEKNSEVPTLAELGRLLGLNRNKLCFGFRQLFGVTITEFCTERRLERARQLLLDTQMNISEIALSIGYSATGNFSTAFQRRFGCTPGSARRRGRT